MATQDATPDRDVTTDRFAFGRSRIHRERSGECYRCPVVTFEAIDPDTELSDLESPASFLTPVMGAFDDILRYEHDVARGTVDDEEAGEAWMRAIEKVDSELTYTQEKAAYEVAKHFRWL